MKMIKPVVLGAAWTAALLMATVCAGFSKTVILGGKPWKFAGEYWKYVASPDTFGKDQQIRISVSPVVPLPWGK